MFNLGRKRKSTKEEEIDQELTEIFSFYAQFQKSMPSKGVCK